MDLPELKGGRRSLIRNTSQHSVDSGRSGENRGGRARNKARFI